MRRWKRHREGNALLWRDTEPILRWLVIAVAFMLVAELLWILLLWL